MKVLLIDDEPVLRQLLARALEKLGFDVEDVGNGDEALSIYRERGPFCCVMSDLSHPGADALQLGWAFRKINPSQPMLIFTGAPLCDLGRAVHREFPDVPFLEKPLQLGNANKALKGALETAMDAAR